MHKRPYWYVNSRFIRPKVRHSWTEEERKKIYSLRKQGKSVDEIIQILKLDCNRIQVYNVIHGETNTRKGKCSCGAKLSKAEVYEQRENVSVKCIPCLKKNSDLKKRLRRHYLRRHLCGICGKRKKMVGYTTCRLCLSADYRRSYLQGLCGKCHTKPISKHSRALCDDCLKINRKKTHAYRLLAHANS